MTGYEVTTPDSQQFRLLESLDGGFYRLDRQPNGEVRVMHANLQRPLWNLERVLPSGTRVGARG